MKFKDILETDWFNELQQKYWKSNKTICPFCGKKLYRKYEGLVCKNFACLLGDFKLGKGWVYLDPYEKKNSNQFFKDELHFKLDRLEIQKRWLELKHEIFFERERKCEICSNEYFLHVHHIIPRFKAPNLTLDKENLMIVCEECHKKLHANDKWRFG